MPMPGTLLCPARGAIGRAFLAALMAVGMLGCLAAPSRANAKSSEARDATQTEVAELEVKAAYLYKFVSYVEWPGGAFRDPAQPIAIGVLGNDDLADELQRLVQGKSVKGRGFVVRKLQPGDDLGDIHILFLGDIELHGVTSALEAAASRDVLTVSDSRRVFASGSMINLVMVKQRLRFEVALRPVQRSRLRLSALMLTAAYRVQQDRP